MNIFYIGPPFSILRFLRKNNISIQKMPDTQGNRAPKTQRAQSQPAALNVILVPRRALTMTRFPLCTAHPQPLPLRPSLQKHIRSSRLSSSFSVSVFPSKPLPPLDALHPTNCAVNKTWCNAWAPPSHTLCPSGRNFFSFKLVALWSSLPPFRIWSTL